MKTCIYCNEPIEEELFEHPKEEWGADQDESVIDGIVLKNHWHNECRSVFLQESDDLLEEFGLL